MRPVRAACAGLSLLAVVVLWPAMPGAQGGRAMTIDDLIGAVRVADPQLSPDGRTVAYVRTTTDLKSGRRNADLWVVPADGRRGKGAHRRRQVREHAALEPERQAAGVHLHSRRRAAGLCRGRRRQQRPQDHRAGQGRAAAAHLLARRHPDRVRVRRLPGMRRRGLQQAAQGRDREESGQGAPPHAPAVAALGRMARERPPSRDGRGPAVEARRRRDARRFRLAAGTGRRQRHRLFARRQGARVRVEPRRERSRGLDDEQRRLPGAGDRRRARRS